MNTVTIHYCRQCNWLMRSSWMGQELLTTFAEELDELRLQPGTGGVFEVFANDARVWSRKDDGGFPDIVELKRRVRDQIAPERDLGHADRKASE